MVWCRVDTHGVGVQAIDLGAGHKRGLSCVVWLSTLSSVGRVEPTEDKLTSVPDDSAELT
jgi:hypothetical protein